MIINLYELNLITIIFRIILAVIFGGIVGLERDVKNHGAGFKTHIIVCLGATLIMMTSQFTMRLYPHLTIDPTRMGAQVISGIGFLGAGTILITATKKITGLTTAAGLWTASVIGLAIGIGFYEGAIGGVLALIITLVFFNRFKNKLNLMSKVIHLYVVMENVDTYHQIISCIAKSDVQLLEVRNGLENLNIPSHQENPSNITCIFSLHLNHGVTRDHVLEKIASIEGTQFVEALG